MYHEFSESYDMMVQFDSKWEKQKTLWQGLVEKHSAETVLDFGCGTGFHSLLLGSLGLKVIGVDPTAEMIHQAEKNKEKYAPNSNVTFICGDIYSIAESHDHFDWILCLGNTLPHFHNERGVKEFLIFAFQHLNKFSTLWIQLLNYHKIISNKERMVGITGDENHTFVRFYDFLDGKVNFNILNITRNEKSFSHKWHQNELFPVTADEIKKYFGDLLLYEHVEFFADFNETPFDKEASGNLVLLAHKL